jgi:hypothetical protein
VTDTASARQRPRALTIVWGIEVVIVATLGLLAATGVIPHVTPWGVLWTAVSGGVLLMIIAIVAASVRSSLADRAAALAVEPDQPIG